MFFGNIIHYAFYLKKKQSKPPLASLPYQAPVTKSLSSLIFVKWGSVSVLKNVALQKLPHKQGLRSLLIHSVSLSTDMFRLAILFVTFPKILLCCSKKANELYFPDCILICDQSKNFVLKPIGLLAIPLSITSVNYKAPNNFIIILFRSFNKKLSELRQQKSKTLDNLMWLQGQSAAYGRLFPNFILFLCQIEIL